MKKISLQTIISLFIILQNYIYSQEGSITCQLFMEPVMPSMISEWQTNNSLICLVLDTSYSDKMISIEGSLHDLNRNDEVAAFRTRIIRVPNPPKPLCARQVIDMSVVEFKSDYYISRAGATGRIPEGNYRLCLVVKDVSGNKMECEVCSEFLVIIPDPVDLILPLNGDTLSSSNFPEFTWTPVLTAGLLQEMIKYELKIVPVFEGQSLKDATDKNPVIVNRNVTNTTYRYLPSDPPFTLYPTAKSFVWQVKALNTDGSPATRNDGFSEPRWFYYQTEKLTELPPGPKEQIDLSIKNWNKYYGTNVKAVDWSYEGKIINEIQRDQILEEITDPEKAWFPSGDVLKPDRMTAIRISDDKLIKEEVISSWRKEIDEKIKIGSQIVKIKWAKSGQTFTSVCISDDDSLIYDNMLFNISLVEEHHSCFSFTIKWIWGGERGKITACVDAECKDGILTDFHKMCVSNIVLGDAKVNCVATQTENCCKLDYSWAFKTGFQTIKTGGNGFTLELEGAIGSGSSGESSIKECCSGN